MQIKSNKYLLARIRNHEVGIMYPNLIPYITLNIVLQRDNGVFNPDYYPYFRNWFFWAESREGHVYWSRINETLSSK